MFVGYQTVCFLLAAPLLMKYQARKEKLALESVILPNPTGHCWSTLCFVCQSLLHHLRNFSLLFSFVTGVSSLSGCKEHLSNLIENMKKIQ